MIDSAFVHMPPCHFQRADRLRARPRFQLERREIREREIRSEPGCGGFGVPPVKASGRGRVADFPGGVHQQHVASTTADATDRQNTVNRL